MWDDERDARLRREAMAWLAIRTNDGADAISSSELLEFTFDGEPVPTGCCATSGAGTTPTTLRTARCRNIVAHTTRCCACAVRNGLALCKIHHAAFDANILGVRPDLAT